MKELKLDPLVFYIQTYPYTPSFSNLKIRRIGKAPILLSISLHHNHMPIGIVLKQVNADLLWVMVDGETTAYPYTGEASYATLLAQIAARNLGK